MVSAAPTTDDVWTWLGEVSDPEIPVLSVIDLGIVRSVRVDPAAGTTVTITPTYCGCPAMEAITREIERTLRSRGLAKVRVDTLLAPAWTTDWMTSDARRKLREYGIAPPAPGGCGAALETPPACPRCGSHQTRRLSRFGSTPCKAIYACTDCLEPFDAFKCH